MTLSQSPPDAVVDDTRTRSIMTPEGVALEFQLATIGERGAAFVADLLLIFGAMAIVGLAATLAGMTSSVGGWLAAFGVVVVFVLRHLYFVGFELHQGGRTPGKRTARVRVIDARGGQLGADAVFVRNLTRDLELTVPALVLFAPSLIGNGVDGWIQAGTVVWLGAFALMPLLNRDRMRVGDLLAGTIVVREPRAQLLTDLVTVRRQPDGGRREEGVEAALEFVFSHAQLSMYGIRELEVLADLLRREDARAGDDFAVVCEKIMRKIAWAPERWRVAPERFLRAFYVALRARLEHRMLLGERRERKKEGQLRPDQ